MLRAPPLAGEHQGVGQIGGDLDDAVDEIEFLEVWEGREVVEDIVEPGRDVRERDAAVVEGERGLAETVNGASFEVPSGPV